ncbi:MAG TPA: GNAT family N-acetyltransferase [Acidimicrobiia bacterium]|nr:GNAT family N-acetyltransferase [Acidimicrobiia bacterium]
MRLDIRPVSEDEFDALIVADHRGFGIGPDPTGSVQTWARGELDRTRVAFEGSNIVGVSRTYSFQLTLPGNVEVPAAAVSWVSVLPTHRRRGVLTQLLRALHDDARDRDEPCAILTASEGGIYQRFGYGIASWRLGLSADRARIRFHTNVDEGSMELVTRAEAEVRLPAIYDQTRRLRAGMVSRPDFWWPQVFWGLAEGHGKGFFVAVHRDADGRDDGYAAYEIQGEWSAGLADRRLLVWDIQSTTSSARAALWRYVFGVDLVATVAATNVPIDEPLKHLVTDPRRVRVDFINDGLWVAPLDAAGLLASRRYAADVQLVFEVHEPGGGRHVIALEACRDDVACEPTTAKPHITCSAATLGAASLGGNRWTELAAGGAVEADDASSLVLADLAFSTTPAPAMVGYF